jgi:hypothetical protein
MDLVYTSFNLRGSRTSRTSIPDWIRETNSLCSVSCHNLVVFTSALPLTEKRQGLNRVYCADLNSPWDCSLVCTLSSPVSCLSWNGTGSKFAVGDCSGNVSVWKMLEFCISKWDEVYTTKLPHERIVNAGFLSSSRSLRLNPYKKDSVFYNEKFEFGPQADGTFDCEVCIFTTSSGLLTAVVLNDSAQLSASACVGRSRNCINFVDIATLKSGEFLLAACGSETPVTVYRISCSLTPQEGLQVHVLNHSSFSVSQNDENVRISALKFVLADSSDAIVVGMDGADGGKVRMWELEYTQHSCHKLFTQSSSTPKHKLVPNWRYCSEFGAGGAKLVSLATPRSSIVGGERPSCYVAVGFSDGSIQCLIRDSLHQISSVELPRNGNISLDNSQNDAAVVTICDMCFTSTGTGLLVTDSLGQLYLYRMSPIADPGGPHVAPYLVTMYEYCLVSGRDWWDLGLAASQTNIQNLTDKLEETYMRQPGGVKNFCYNRYMSMRASLFRLCPQSQYRASDTLAIMMLRSIYGDLSSLLNIDGGYPDLDPAEKLTNFLRNCPSSTDLNSLVSSLLSNGFSREVPTSSETTQSLHQLGSWVLTLALHLLSAVPEFKTRRGPGFWLMQEGGVSLIRDILVMLRLWGLPRAGFITREKDLDLNSKLFSMISKLKDNPEDESLLDECLILPSLVIVPELDVMVSPSGVLAGLQAGMNLPLSFQFGVEPNLTLPPQPVFLEGLPYTEESSGSSTYDSINKTSLGRNPSELRTCNRCRSHTQGVPVNPGTWSWEKRWNRNCCCGGSWRIVKNDGTRQYQI